MSVIRATQSLISSVILKGHFNLSWKTTLINAYLQVNSDAMVSFKGAFVF